MNNMTELISWFQLEYAELVKSMKASDHHFTDSDQFFMDARNGGAKQGRLKDLKKHPVNLNPYHCESDVFTHTMLVCKQAENAPYLVKLAALLHDIGKPATRSVNPKNGRVSFYNHDAVGAFMSLEILKREELGLTKQEQVHVFNLIALHTQIYKLSVEQLAEIGDFDLIGNLIELGKADHSGRFHTKGDAEIPLGSHIVVSYKGRRDVSDLEKEVIVLVGLPSSGKSTWVRKKCMEDEEFGQFIISRDGILEENTIGKDYEEKWKNADQKQIDRLLQSSYKWAKEFNSVVVDMTHMSKKSRRRTLSHFDNSYKKKAVVFLTDMQKLRLQNEKRSGKIIGENVINKMMRSFYPPTLAEFDEIEYVL